MIIDRPLRKLAIAIVVLLAGCGAPAQIGTDKEAFKTVDALYTAVSLRELPLVDQCQSQLSVLAQSGKMPKAAGETLESIIAEAKTGKWEPAQTRLAKFMEGQRR